MRHFSLIHPDQPVEVKVDPLRIEQVIGNLLDNAQKYSPERQPIDIKIDLLPNKIRISVTDHGIGISKEQQHSLFSRFFRISSNETIRHPGLGLGLFICRSIVELHKGTIGVESEINQGSTFYFDLPRETDV
jgi:signal transduction histidine kinase